MMFFSINKMIMRQVWGCFAASKECLIVIVCFLLAFSCQALANKSGETNLIGSQYKQVEDLADKKHYNAEQQEIWQSDTIKHFLNSKSDFFMIRSASGVDNQTNIELTEVIPLNSLGEFDFGKNKSKYLFIEKKIDSGKQLVDTLNVPAKFQYAVINYQIENSGPGFGIALGVYKLDTDKQGNQQHYFEIHQLYGLTEQGKYQLALDTVIFDCLIEDSYQGDESDEIPYVFGVKGGKKYSRLWNEN